MKLIKYSSALTAIAMCLMMLLAHGQENAEKGTINIYLGYHQRNNDLPVMKVSAKTKKDRKFEAVEGVEVNVFFNTESSQGFIGRVKTNYLGNASLSLPARFKAQWDSLTNFKFIGTLTQNDRFEDQSSELEITKAKIELTLEDVDSVRTIRAKVLAYQDTGWVAQPDTEIKLVVRGMMSDLRATEEETFTTDENGEVSAEFTLRVPGDTQGDIIIGAKMDEHEMYGSVTSAKTVKWGLPRAPDNSFAKRTLWATRDKTPLWLLIFPNLIIVTVWGIIFYLVYQITRIIKLGKANDSI